MPVYPGALHWPEELIAEGVVMVIMPDVEDLRVEGLDEDNIAVETVCWHP